MQINGSNSNSLAFQPNAGKQTNQQTTVSFDSRPVVADYPQVRPSQTSSSNKTVTDLEQAKYVRTFSSKAANVLNTEQQNSTVQLSAITEYQKVSSISSNIAGRIIDEVV